MKNSWPTVRERRDGRGWQVDLGKIDGKRVRLNYPTEAQANTKADHLRNERDNLGTLARVIPDAVRFDAVKANQLLSPYGATILQAAQYYKDKYLVFKQAPLIKDIVAQLIKEKTANNRRHRTISDLRNRLQNNFAAKFGDKHLTDLTLDDCKNWLLTAKDFRTRTNLHSKGSLLFNYAMKQRPKWIDENLFDSIDKPQVDIKPVAIFTVDEAKRLLLAAKDIGILPYIAVSLFAGIRMEELSRMRGRHFDFQTKSIFIDATITKVRKHQRTIEMLPALLAYLEPYKDKIKDDFRIIDDNKATRTRKQLLTSANIKAWKIDIMRHSYGTYHLAAFQNAAMTASQMGNSVEVLHRDYKKPVLKSEADKYWALRP